MPELGSARFAVELVHIAYLALTVEASARIMVPLLTAITTDPLLAIADFDLGVGRLA